MSTTLYASLAFAGAAALGTTQVRSYLTNRATSKRVRQMAGIVPLDSETVASPRLRLPNPWRERQRKNRAALLSSQLAAALELMIGHLKIGRNIGAAVAEVADSVPEPLHGLLVEAVEEARLGTPLSDSLQRLGALEGNRHLDVVASAIGLQSRHGGSLVEILETVHTTIDEEDRLQRDIRTLTADNRLSAKVLLALPPIVLVVVSLFNPGYATPLVTDPLGQRMSAVGAVLAFIGWRWLRRLANPAVVA
jgi:tight adherence protein B